MFAGYHHITKIWPNFPAGKAAYAGGLLAAASWGFVLGVAPWHPTTGRPRAPVGRESGPKSCGGVHFTYYFLIG